jgi:hypothetical protein
MTAASAEAVEFEAVSGNGEAVPGGDFLLKLFDLAVFKLHDLAAVGANQMIVMTLVGNVVILRLRAEMPGLCQTCFAKKVEGAVDGCEPQVRVFLRQLVVHCFGGDVLLLEEGVENEFTLTRVLQLVLAEVRFQRLHLFHMFGHKVRPTFLLT